MKVSRMLAAGAACVALGIGAVAPSAGAATSGPWDRAVSCDGVTTQAGVTVRQGSAGNLSFRQSHATHNSKTNVRMVNKNTGAITALRTLGSPQTTTWSVGVGYWFPRMHRSGPANCNGVLPGNGNYTVTYILTFRG